MVILPRWFYEPLPYVYGGVGLVAMFSLDSLVGVVSGILLVSAGGVIAYQRYQYRYQEKQRQERLAWLQEQARRKKSEKQAWLREQAQKVREEIEKKEQDF
jgi:predicted Holliday junction resolvase-like endonuclease